MLTKLREKIGKLITENKELLDLAETEERGLTEDEKKVWDERAAEIEILKSTIEKKEHQEELNEWAGKSVNEPIKPEPEVEDGGEGEVRAGEDRAAKKPYASFGEQLLDVIRAEKRDGEAIRRLREVRATGMSEGIPADGGFLVQTDFATQLLKRAYENSVVLPKTTNLPIKSGANSISINAIAESSRADGSRMGGIRGYWVSEGAAKTASHPEFEQITLKPNKLVVLCYATDELLQDDSALEALIMQLAPDEINFKIQDSAFNGSGAGQLLGILNAGCLVSVAKETGQAAATIVAQNIVKMWSRMYGPSRGKAAWFINQDIEPQLHQLNLAVGTGGSLVYMPANGLSASPYATLYGRPVIPVEQCQTLGTKGDIYFADFSQYLTATIGGMQSASSIHVKFTYDETVFRFVYRIDGRPWWSSALTPYKGGATKTQSPFISLDVRA